MRWIRQADDSVANGIVWEDGTREGKNRPLAKEQARKPKKGGAGCLGYLNLVAAILFGTVKGLVGAVDHILKRVLALVIGDAD